MDLHELTVGLILYVTVMTLMVGLYASRIIGTVREQRMAARLIRERWARYRAQLTGSAPEPRRT